MNAHHVLTKRILLSLLSLALVIPVSAENWIRYQARPGSKVRIDGTATAHDWFVEGKIIGGFMELESNFPLDPSAKAPASAKVNAKVEVEIPVTSLQSGKKLMDDFMYETMKEKDYRTIKYRLKDISPKTDAQGGGLQFNATGELTIAGVTKTSAMLVTFEKVDSTRLKVKGQAALKMTDFGIKPPAPTIGLGILKTGDDIKITFEWVTALKVPDKN